MREHQIYVIDGPGIQGHSTPDAHEVYYFEGVSGKLAASDEGPSGWFCFEEPFDVGCAELTKLGFTAEQIITARREMEAMRASR
jgi:hypothetical protein